jgi:hypothetical protein
MEDTYIAEGKQSQPPHMEGLMEHAPCVMREDGEHQAGNNTPPPLTLGHASNQAEKEKKREKKSSTLT